MTGGVDKRLTEWEPLASPWRTPEQMRQIQSYFKPDGLGRIARSTPEYYETHGDYLPNVAALAHAALVALVAAEARADEAINRAEAAESRASEWKRVHDGWAAVAGAREIALEKAEARLEEAERERDQARAKVGPHDGNTAFWVERSTAAEEREKQLQAELEIAHGFIALTLDEDDKWREQARGILAGPDSPERAALAAGGENPADSKERA